MEPGHCIERPTLSQLSPLTLVTQYVTNMLANKLFNSQMLVIVLDKLLGLCSVSGSEKTDASKLLTVNDFLSLAELDNINFFVLLRFCEKSQIARKLTGFVGKLQSQPEVVKP